MCNILHVVCLEITGAADGLGCCESFLLPDHLLTRVCATCICRFANETQHLENSDTEVTGERGAFLARKMSNAAEQWWQSVATEPASFQKPTFYLGFGNWTVTNMLAAGAHERTPSRVQLMINGAKGFYNAGDSMCFKLKVSTTTAVAAAGGAGSSRGEPSSCHHM
jgi:hypothetical protein